MERNMEARKLAMQMVAICPFAMILGIGYSARRPVPNHRTLKYSEVQDARIVAYRQLVIGAPSPSSSYPVVRRHADLWIRTAVTKGLQPLMPAFQEDLTEDNARCEILGQWRWVGARLNHEMRKELESKDFAAAVEDGVRVLQLGEILKYSDFDSMHLVAT